MEMSLIISGFENHYFPMDGEIDFHLGEVQDAPRE